MNAAILLKVARAIERGTLPNTAIIETGYGIITIHIDRRARPTDQAEWLDWVQRNFPGGTERRTQLGYTALGAGRYQRPGKKSLYDRVAYIAEFLTFTYFVEHECREFYGRFGADGHEEYRSIACRHCKKSMTVTEQRRRGLLPPLVRGKKVAS